MKTTILMFLALVGCATYGDVSVGPPAAVVDLPMNYQAVYANALHTMRTCMNPGMTVIPGATSVKIEADLFSDLGYGEITVGLSGGMPDTFSVTRIEKTASGSRLSIWSGNMLPAPAARDRAWIVSWAKGGKSCSSGFDLPPT